MAHDSHGHGHGPVDDPNFVHDKPYETREFFDFPTVLKWIFMLFVFVGATSAVTVVIFNIMVPRTSERTSAYPLPQVRALPPEGTPRLQANPMLDIRTFREQEHEELTTYGRDPKTGDVHIPIDRAIDIVSQEGLPTRANPGQPNPNEPNEPSYTLGDVAGTEDAHTQTGVIVPGGAQTAQPPVPGATGTK